MSDLEILGTMPTQRALDNVQFEFDNACESIIDAVAKKGSIEYANYNWQKVPYYLRVTLSGASEKHEDDPTLMSQSGAAFVTGAIVGLMLGRKMMASISERRRYFGTVNGLLQSVATHETIEDTIMANARSSAQDIAGRGHWKLLALVGSEPHSSYRRSTARVYSHSIAYMASIAHTERLSHEVDKAQFGNFSRVFRLDSATRAMRHEAEVLANDVLSDETLHHYLTGPTNS